MNEEYEDFKEIREEKREGKTSFFSKFSHATWIILGIVIFFGYYLLRMSNVAYKDYLIPAAIAIVIIYAIGRGESKSTSITYINEETAKQILLDWLKNYNKLRKEGICRIILPKGEVEMGYPDLEKSPFNLITPIAWHIGFLIYDDDENGNAKYFVGKIDPEMGGKGVEGINPLETEFKGVKQKVYKEIIVSSEKYAELKARKMIP